MQSLDWSIFGNLLVTALGYGYFFFIILAPVFLGFAFFEAFVTYNRNKFIHEKAHSAILLELIIPQEVAKSPLAMELFLTSLYQTSGETTWIDRWFKGKTRPWFSLELVSDGGEIKFYLWTWDFWKPVVVSYLYAQYPDIEVREVDDYSKNIDFDLRKIDLFGVEFKLNKPDYYPIKSYNDYKLGDDPKEEYKIDPMTPFFEYLSTVKQGDRIWLQVIVRSHKKEIKKPGTWFDKVDWSHGANEEIKKIKQADVQAAGEIKITGVSLSRGQKDAIEAIEKNISKLAFDTLIRVIYLAPKEKFNPINIPGLIGSFRQYNTANLNSFGVSSEHITVFDYPWQDMFGKKAAHRKHHIFEAYQHRSAFHAPHKSHYFTMSSESIATIFHFPGEAAKTPGLRRIDAKKSEAPPNLPV